MRRPQKKPKHPYAMELTLADGSVRGRWGRLKQSGFLGFPEEHESNSEAVERENTILSSQVPMAEKNLPYSDWNEFFRYSVLAIMRYLMNYYDYSVNLGTQLFE